MRDKIRQFEKLLQDRILPADGGSVQPLDLWDRIREAVLEQVVPGLDGASRFPFTRVMVHLAAATPVEQARLEGSLRPEMILPRLAQLLADERVLHDPALGVDVTAALRTEENEPAIRLAFSSERPAPTVKPAAARLVLRVEAGEADPAEITLLRSRTNLGRRERITRDGRLERRNHLAFADIADPVNASVSRHHAHIDYDEAAQVYRLYLDSPQADLKVEKSDGRFLDAVPRGGDGVIVEPGDLLYLGKALIRVLA